MIKQEGFDSVEISKGLWNESDFRAPNLPELRTDHLAYLGEEEECHVYQGHTYNEILSRAQDHGDSSTVRQYESAFSFCEKIKESGGRALIVGGAVRDEVFGKIPKDVDIEVYGVDPNVIKEVASTIGRLDLVGKAFGVLKVFLSGGGELDISFPRKDSRPDTDGDWEIAFDPNMTIKEAARRRDFTWNALAKDILTGQIYDGYGGIDDAKKRILRVTDVELFQDDALRVMRAAQFMSRLGLTIDRESEELILEMVPRLEKIPKERMGREWEKLLVKSQKPSLGLQKMMDWGILQAFYPEIYQMRTTPQEFEWHPEGDVWIHTLMVVDEAKKIAARDGLDDQTSFELILSALCHDLGKPLTTAFQEKNGRMRITSNGHEPAGVDPAKTFLFRLGVNQKIIERVAKVVAEHLSPGSLYRDYKKDLIVGSFNPVRYKRSIRRLAERVSPSSINMLVLLSEADYLGRGPFLDPSDPDQFLLLYGYEAGPWLREASKEAGVEMEKPKPIIGGEDLIATNILTKKDGKFFKLMIECADRTHNTLGFGKPKILTTMASLSEMGYSHNGIVSFFDFLNKLMDLDILSHEDVELYGFSIAHKACLLIKKQGITLDDLFVKLKTMNGKLETPDDILGGIDFLVTSV